MRAVQKPEARLRKLTPLHFRLLKVSFPKKVLAGRPFNIAVILKAGGNIRRGVVEILLPPSLSIGADSAEQVGGTHRVYSGPIGEGLLTQLVVTHLKALTPGDHILTVCIRSEEPGRSEVRRVARVKVKKP